MSDDDRTVYERMADALADFGPIVKKRSKGVTYEFRGIDDVMNALHPILSEHGLFLSPQVEDDWQVNMIETQTKSGARSVSQALFRVSVIVTGRKGDWMRLGPGLAQSHDFGDKAVYQAQQNAIKYVLLEAFCVPTNTGEDMDTRPAPEIAGPPPEPEWDAKAWAAKATSQGPFREWTKEQRADLYLTSAKQLVEEGVLPSTKPANPREGDKIIDRMKALAAKMDDDQEESDGEES